MKIKMKGKEKGKINASIMINNDEGKDEGEKFADAQREPMTRYTLSRTARQRDHPLILLYLSVIHS